MDDFREIFLPLILFAASFIALVVLVVGIVFITSGYFVDRPACERYSVLTNYETDWTLSSGCLVKRGIGDWVTLDSARSNKIEITDRKIN